MRSAYRCLLSRVVLGAFALICVAAPLAAPAANGAEPAKEFLAGLRERAMYDVALEYLDWMESSPLVAQDVKDTISFERGVTLVDAARTVGVVKLREQYLDKALAELNGFVKDFPKHDRILDAKMQLGRLNVTRALMRVADAERTPQPDARKKLFDEAGAFFADATKSYDARKTAIKTLLDPLEKWKKKTRPTPKKLPTKRNSTS